jgi:hypothetical protein
MLRKTQVRGRGSRAKALLERHVVQTGVQQLPDVDARCCQGEVETIEVGEVGVDQTLSLSAGEAQIVATDALVMRAVLDVVMINSRVRIRRNGSECRDRMRWSGERSH